ncbi:MAG: DUF3798 domain-containing protein [Tissierellia bacterium]|nr:DUF3798 domain-containing protein [Tissierellia bacterium]MDD4780759.1 DUF3798 domain-containing protein [Tissierellia bacterium]
MRRILSILLVLCLVLSIVGCSNESNTTQANDDNSKKESPVEPSPEGKGKVAIITNTLSQNEEEYRSAQSMVEKYGDRIVHELWPDNFMTEQEQMVTIVSKLAADPEIKALIINQAVPGTNAAVDKLLETRDDMFIVYSTPQENPPDVATRADLILMPDELKMGDNIPVQAQKLGAKTLVHYSFPRHMSQVLLSARRELMRAKCEEIGIEFVDATAPDPTGDQGVTGAQQFILEDVPKKVQEYGKDTAFFSTNCAMQIPLIKAAVDEGAIYPQPCCPSPYHGYPTALGIESGDYSEDSLQNVIDETTRILEEKGVLGRFSTWPVPVAMMSTVASTEYAIKWMDGEVGDELDLKVLEQCMADYAGVAVETSAYVEEGTEYPNYRLIIMDFLTYGEQR